MFCDSTEQQYAPTFLTDNVGELHSLIKFCGETGKLERVKDYYKYNLIEYIGRLQKCLQFRYVNKYIGLENFEILEGISGAERILNGQSSELDALDKKSAVIKQMKKYVRPWGKYFIGYETNEAIDTYYFDIAKLYVERVFDFDCFNDNAKFGGIPYKIYRQCATLIISFELL